MQNYTLKITATGPGIFNPTPLQNMQVNFLLANYKTMHPKKVLLLMQKILNKKQSKKHINRRAIKTCRVHIQPKSKAFLMAILNNNCRLFSVTKLKRYQWVHGAINYSLV